jgi:ABC-type antimicrobial peptide transport system permease subunit
MAVLVRTTGPAESLLTVVAATAKAVDPRRFPELALLKDSYREKVRTSEYAALSAGLLGLVALLLACVGIVGLVAYGVAQRTKEIGIRLALGATAFQVLSAVLRTFSRPVVVGLLLGVGGAAMLSQVLRQVLYGVSHLDPVAYAAATALLAIAAAIAAGIPARRALRVDPIRALRCE